MGREEVEGVSVRLRRMMAAKRAMAAEAAMKLVIRKANDGREIRSISPCGILAPVPIKQFR